MLIIHKVHEDETYDKMQSANQYYLSAD